MSTGQLPFLRRTTCPHCWTSFAPEDVLWIATYPDLLDDPRLGSQEQQRFLPTRFNIDGNALDAKGFACRGLACPRCRRTIARTLLETEPAKPHSPTSSQSALDVDGKRLRQDYRRLVDEIGSILQSGDQNRTEELKSLAQAYAGACQEVNERLRRCGDLLKQGLRSEAIHLEQSEPGLLDQVAVLDFPKRSEWAAVLRAHGLPLAPPLEFEIAADLNHAYAELVPLEALLKEHRLLALSRAPLSLRLQTMKRIALEDSNNPIWAEDIRGFESVRFSQLEAEAKQAAAREDETALQAIREELQLTGWSQEPPLALVRNAEAALERLRQKKFRAYMEELLARLQEAFAAKDLHQARRLRKLWEEGTAQAGLAREDPLRERAAPALGWLAREERREAQERQRQAALQEFEGLVDASPNREVLERHLELFRAQGPEIPAALMRRYQNRLEGFLKTERQRRIYIGGALLAGLFLITSVLSFWIYKVSQAKKADEAVAQLDQWIESGQLLQAKEYLDELSAKDARLVNRPELADLRQRLAKEVERRFLFQQALRRAIEESLDEPEGPALAKAEELARFRGEKDDVQRVRQARKERIWELQKQRDEAFLPWFRDLQEKVNRLEGMLQESSNSPAIETLLTALDKEMARLPTESKGISEPKRQWAQEVTARFKKVRDFMDSRKQEAQLVEQLSLSLHRRQSVADYVEAAKAYVKTFPETSRGKELARVLSEQPHWEAVVAWHQLIEPWASKPFDVKVDEAAERAARCNQFLSQHPLYVDAEFVREYASCLAAIGQQQESATGSAAAKLRELFAGLVVKDLWVVKMENGKTYYLKENLQRDVQKAKELGNAKGYVNVRYLTNGEGKEKSTIVKADDVETTSRAPQSLVADLVQKMPANFAAKTWEEAMLAIAQKIRSSQEMDPVLQVSLLKRVLNLAALGSSSLSLALAEHQKQLKEASLDLEVTWIDPNNTAASAVRRDARHVLERLPSLEPVQKAAKIHRAKLEDAVKRSDLSPVGWLTRNRNRWHCRSAFLLSGTHELCILTPGPGGTADWCQIGKNIKGTTTIEVVKLDAFLEGRLVHSPAAPLLPEWHYLDSEQKRRGPVSREMLINLLYNEVINSSTPVWKTGLPNWVELSSPEAGLIIPMKRPDASEAVRPDEPEAANKGRQTAEIGEPAEDWQAVLGWRRLHMGISLVLLAVFLLLGAVLLAIFSVSVSSIGKEKGASFAFVVMILAYLLGFGGQLVETVGYGICTARSARSTPKGLAITAFILGVVCSVLGACLLILFLITARVSSARVNPAASEADNGAFVVIWTLAVLVGMAKPMFFLFYLRALAVSLRARKLARSFLNVTILYGLAAFLLFFVLFVPLLYPSRLPTGEAAALGAAAMALLVFRIISYGLLLAWFAWYVLILYQTRQLLAERLPV